MPPTTSAALLSIFPFVFATDPQLQLHGWIGVLAGAVPLLLTARYLVSDQVFVYRYEDVPPHVRRIAQRERQRVELETARNIQNSILPQLPPQLNEASIVVSRSVHRKRTTVATLLRIQIGAPSDSGSTITGEKKRKLVANAAIVPPAALPSLRTSQGRRNSRPKRVV